MNRGSKIINNVMLKSYVTTDWTKEVLKEMSDKNTLPVDHVNYLAYLANNNIKPNVIYDIGSAVKHWTNVARQIWPTAQYYLFEGTRAMECLYENENYNIDVLSNEEKIVDFYEHPYNPGGNSLYKENVEYCIITNEIYTPAYTFKRHTKRLDRVVAERMFPTPDFMKIDVQGAELEILRGAGDLLKTLDHLIVEISKVEYNLGSPKPETVIAGLEELGFVPKKMFFAENEIDGDCHFVRKT